MSEIDYLKPHTRPKVSKPVGYLEEIPEAFYWSTERVADWIEDLGYPHYRECFTKNNIDGKRLITVDASSLPKMGIQKFHHVLIIAKAIRQLIELEEPDSKRTSLYLELKLMGNPLANHSIPRFVNETEGSIARTTLANMGFIYRYPGFSSSKPDCMYYNTLCRCDFAGRTGAFWEW